MRTVVGICSLIAVLALMPLIAGCEGGETEPEEAATAATPTLPPAAVEADTPASTTATPPPAAEGPPARAASTTPTAPVTASVAAVTEPTATQPPPGAAPPPPPVEPSATSASPSAAPDRAPEPPSPGLSPEQARDKLSRATILLGDLGAGFTVLSDRYIENAEAAAPLPDPDASLAFFDASGRVLGRSVVHIARNVTETAMAGQSVAFFSSVTAFQDAAGAAQNYALAIDMIAQGVGVGTQFADVFVNPDDITIERIPSATVGDERQAFILSGETEAQGQRYAVTALLLAMRRGPVMAFVGSIRVAVPPDVAEVERLARLLVERIDREF